MHKDLRKNNDTGCNINLVTQIHKIKLLNKVVD